MTRSLAHRIFLAMFGIGLTNVAVTLVATEVIFEDIEKANLTVALAQERDHFVDRITGPGPQHWETALLSVHYLPDHYLDRPQVVPRLPEIFRDRPVPFADEVERGDRTFLVSIEAVPSPPGVMYLAQDISIIEDREDLLQEIGFALLALLMSSVCLILAFAGSRYIIRPLKQLTGEIRAISPDRHLAPVQLAFRDRELEEIRSTLNELLTALNAHIEREKALVNMASHELRTPVAVIAGALDVMEQRNTLGASDQRTLARVRQATSKMQSDISALLKLARLSRDARARTEHPTNLIDTVIQELEGSNPDFSGRIRRLPAESPVPLAAEADLAHMLVRNLLQNALRHTQGPVSIHQHEATIEIADNGAGLPDSARQVLVGPGSQQPPEDGLGLYIVRLLAERMDCQLEILAREPSGTTVRVRFRPAPPLTT